MVEDSTGQALINLINALTTNHRSFFREPAHFDFLRNTFVPEYRNQRTIDVWSAACPAAKSGLYHRHVPGGRTRPRNSGKVRILATDISTKVLEKARRATYPADRFDGVSDARLHKFWLRGEGEWDGWYRLKKDLRELVRLERFNLLGPKPTPADSSSSFAVTS